MATQPRGPPGLGTEACSAFQHAALFGSAQLGGAELIFLPKSSVSLPQSCLCRSQERKAGRAEEGRAERMGAGEHGAGERQTLVCFPSLAAEKWLIGCKVSTLPGRSLFLPFRVPPAFLLQRLGSCDCSTPLTPRLLWKPMNCLRKVSWQPLHPFSCLPSPEGLGQCRSPLCRQRPTFTTILCFLTCFFSSTPSLSTEPKPPPQSWRESGAAGLRTSRGWGHCSAAPVTRDVNRDWTSSRTADLPSQELMSCQLACWQNKTSKPLGFDRSPRSRAALSPTSPKQSPTFLWSLAKPELPSACMSAFPAPVTGALVHSLLVGQKGNHPPPMLLLHPLSCTSSPQHHTSSR